MQLKIKFSTLAAQMVGLLKLLGNELDYIQGAHKSNSVSIFFNLSFY